MTDIEPIDWDARLRSAVEKTLNARLARLKTRQALTETRNYGLTARHDNKTKRNRGDNPTDERSAR